jgi:hypothetical protein
LKARKKNNSGFPQDVHTTFLNIIWERFIDGAFGPGPYPGLGSVAIRHKMFIGTSLTAKSCLGQNARHPLTVRTSEGAAAAASQPHAEAQRRPQLERVSARPSDVLRS